MYITFSGVQPEKLLIHMEGVWTMGGGGSRNFVFNFKVIRAFWSVILPERLQSLPRFSLFFLVQIQHLKADISDNFNSICKFAFNFSSITATT